MSEPLNPTVESSVRPTEPILVLLVDDDAPQLKLNAARLQHAGYRTALASGAAEARTCALSERPEVVMSDVVMGETDGFGLCRMFQQDESLASVPIILLSAHYRGSAESQLATDVGACALVTRTPDFEDELRALEGVVRSPPPRPTVCGERESFEKHLRSNANQVRKLSDLARDASERFRTLFDNANDLISVISLDGLVLEVNRRWCETLGVTADTIVGRPIGEFAAHGHRGRNEEAFAETVRVGGAQTEVFVLHGPNGAEVHALASNSVIEVEGQSVVLSIARDITAEVLAKKALAGAEDRYRSLVERIPDVIWTTTAEGRITFMTSNSERVCGFAPAELKERGAGFFIRRIHLDDRRKVRDAFVALMRSGTLFDLEYRWRRKDDAWVWLHGRAIAAYDRHGERHFDGMISDATERKRVEDELRQSQKLEALGLLTSGIAHDFNNVLATILGCTEFLIDGIDESDTLHADAVEIRAAAERAANLTRQLLAFSRKQVLRPARVDLNSVVAGLEKLLRRIIGEDVTLVVELGAELGTVQVDVGQIEQVVMNLVVNARDAMPRGGTLTIRTANVTTFESGSEHDEPEPRKLVMICITDTGEGMDADTLRRIFEPFFTTKEVGKGTGLGLSTCYGIVAQSGGHIGVRSRPGSGSEFRVYLPRLDARAELASVPPRGGRAPGGSETILVVEDDEHMRHVVRRTLESRGYRLLLARDGATAAQIAASEPEAIHLVLSDVVLPGPNGVDVIRALRTGRGSMRALLMSGYLDHPALADGAALVDAPLIRKPFAPELLARRVRDVLDGRASSERPRAFAS